MNRREIIAGLGSAVVSPLAAQAQQPERMRRIGVLVNGLAADDPEWQIRGMAFVQGLQERGWTDGRNVRIDYRWSVGDLDRVNMSPSWLNSRRTLSWQVAARPLARCCR